MQDEYQDADGENGQINPSVEPAMKEKVKWQVSKPWEMERYGQQAKYIVMQGFAFINIRNGVQEEIDAGGVAYKVGIDGKALEH